jgi:hypothetical protein
MPIVRMEAVRWALGRRGEAGAEMDARRSNASGDGAFQFATRVKPSSKTFDSGVGRCACTGWPTRRAGDARERVGATVALGLLSCGGVVRSCL